MKALVANRSIVTRSANLLLGKSIGQGVSVEEVPKPTVADHEILVHVHATALNPIDFKFIDFIAPSGSLTGCDFAGVVAGAGPGAAATWQVGDRVAGFVQGGIDTAHGSFAEYVKAEADLVWRIPDGVDDTEAATYGVSAVTAMQALNLHLGVPWPDQVDGTGKTDDDATIFIYAVITTASPHSFDLVKRYGADHVFDYLAPNAVADIVAAFPSISRALDCFSEGDSTRFCETVLQNSGGKVITLLDTKTKVSGVEAQMIMSFQLLGKAFSWLPPVGPKYSLSSSDREALVRFYKSLFGLAKEIKAPPITVLENGFDGVIEGLNRLRAGKVSGSKLVVTY